MPGRPMFVFEPAINSRDLKTRPAARLYINNQPTQLFAYSKERARAMLRRAERSGEINLFTYNMAVAEVNRLQKLPEVCHDFPCLIICRCTQHAALIDADGEDGFIEPAYSQAMLNIRLERNIQAGNLTSQQVNGLLIKIKNSGLPVELQAEDELAMRMGLAIRMQTTLQAGGRPHIVDQRQFNWCDIHSMAGQHIEAKIILQDQDS